MSLIDYLHNFYIKEKNPRGLIPIMFFFLLAFSLFFEFIVFKKLILFYIVFGLYILYAIFLSIRVLLNPKSLSDEFTSRKKFMKINTEFELVPDEKILFPITQVLIYKTRFLGYTMFPRDVIITNKRILIGVLNSVLFEENFGEFNLWHKNYSISDSTPSTKELTNLLGGNVNIKDIILDKNKKYVEIQVEFIFDTKIKIHHPNASEIYKIFKT